MKAGIAAILVAIVALGGCVYVYTQRPKMAYVKADALFDKFTMTVELKAKLEKAQAIRNNVLDSMLLDLKMGASTKAPKGVLIEMERAYLMKKEAFEKQDREQTVKYDGEIWTRINQYVRDYGIRNKYDLLFGANGTGAIMHGADGLDITDAVLDYMNTSYVKGREE